MKLTESQRAAVERQAPEVCVVAGPGSGKTRVLTEHFAWLIEKQRVDPARILAITFTEKAANEMKRRLVERFEHSPELRSAMEHAWISTIHAFCARLLRENSIAAGLPPDFAVIEQPVADRLMREAAEEALDAMFDEQPAEMRRLMEALDLATDDDGRQQDLAAALLSVYETMRLSGAPEIPAGPASPDVFPEACRCADAILRDPVRGALHSWAAEFRRLDPQNITRAHLESTGSAPIELNRGSKSGAGYEAMRTLKKDLLPRLEGQWIQSFYNGLPERLRCAVAKIDACYREKKRSQGLIDFAGLEEEAIRLLESDAELRARVSGQFDHVLMDELQDTNRLQWRLVNLVRRNLFAVGDINQSIYGFRHADRTVFQQYRDSVPAVDELNDNYRSRQEILDAVSAALHGEEGIEPRPLTARGTFESARGPVVERLVGTGDDVSAAEAALVAARIRAWKDAGRYGYGDFAILLRALTSAPAFEAALEQQNIPFLLSGGRTFLETRETRDLMLFLAALVNPLDDIALAGVLRGPLVGWSDEEIFRRGLEGARAEFERLFGKIRRLAGVIPPDRLIARALDECGFLNTLSDRGRANIDKLLAWIRREHRTRPRPLAELLADAEALRTMQAEAEAPPPEAADAVSMLSIHAAKGLEFPVVFVSALNRGTDRRSPVILFSSDLGLGVKWRNPATGKSVKDGTYTELAARRKAEEEAEENRLLYVAMTRAQERLVLSYGQPKRAMPAVKRAEAAVPVAASPETMEPAAGAAARLTNSMEEVPLPVAGGQHDASVPATTVAQFAACPRKYYLGRYLGLEPESDQSGTGAIDLGVEVHRALAGGAAVSSEAAALVRNFSESDLGKRAARASRREHEFDFLLPFEEILLSGTIDLWFEESGELVLVDYKTDRDESSAAGYSVQLKLYALALEKCAGRLPDRAMLCYLRSGMVREVDLSDLNSVKETVRALTAAQEKLEFEMKVGEQCRHCWFYGGLCPAKLETISSERFSYPPSYVPERPTSDS